MSQYHFTPQRYLQLMAEEVPLYEELQDQTARATEGGAVYDALELGTGTAETARRVLVRHPGARLVGVDESAPMLEQARTVLPLAVDLRVGRLQDALPVGRFDLVFSTLAVHHLTAPEKQDLFRRVAAALRPGGRFVLADVVVPENPADHVTPIEAGHDFPDTLADQLAWLREAGFEAETVWVVRDLAVVCATRL